MLATLLLSAADALPLAPCRCHYSAAAIRCRRHADFDAFADAAAAAVTADCHFA
jgi:hypothetical protein